MNLQFKDKAILSDQELKLSK